MTIPVLICDDSSFARKQMARALPEHWDVSLSYATNGLEAVDAIKSGKAEVMFLDLNMPEMDGYEVLETVRKEDLNSMIIVVSGDIQQDAKSRVTSLGAMDFIKKPVNQEEITVILQDFGLLHLTNTKLEIDINVDNLDLLKEISNVAMGRGIDLLAKLLDVYIPMPIPNVSYIDIQDLNMTLKEISHSNTITPVCQGFVGSGMAGEALLLFNAPDINCVSELMEIKGKTSESQYLEQIMDIASVLSGSCLKGFSEQLDLPFSLGHPRVLGTHVNIDDMIDTNGKSWTKTLALEMGVSFGDKGLNCNLLFLFTEDSLDKLNNTISYLK